MNFAVLQQFDTPDEIYRRPKNLFVANFIGSPTINFLRGGYKNGEVTLVDFPGEKIRFSQQYKKQIDSSLKHEQVVLGIRPEHIEISEKSKKGFSFHATVINFEPLGSETIVYLKTKDGGDNILKSMMDSDYRPGLNTVKHICFDEQDLYLFDEETTDLVLKF